MQRSPGFRGLIFVLLITAQLLPARALLAQDVASQGEIKTKADEIEYLEAKAKALATIEALRAKDVTAAIKLAHKIFEADRQGFGPNHEHGVTTLQVMAGLYWSANDKKNAAGCQSTILAIRENLYGKEDWRRNEARWIAEQWKHLATSKELVSADEQAMAILREAASAYAARDYANSIALAQKSAAILKEVYGDNVPPYGTALGYIAVCLLDQGNLAEARAYYTQAATICQGWYGVVSPQYADILVSLGQATQDEQREQYYRQAIDIYEQIQGYDRSLLVRVLRNLASHYAGAGRLAQSETLLARAMDVQESLHGRDSQIFKDMQLTMAGVYRNLKKYAEAEVLLNSLLAHDNANPQQTVDVRIEIYDERSRIYEDQDKFDLAEQAIRQALDIERKAFGETRLNFAMLLRQLGDIQYSAKQTEAAEATFDKSLALAIKLGGPQSQEALNAADALSVVLRVQAKQLNAKGDHAAARAKLQLIVEKVLPLFDEQNFVTVMTRVAIAQQDQIDQLPADLVKVVLEAERIEQEGRDAKTAGDFPKAEERFRQAIELRAALADKQNPYVTAQANYMLAEVLQKQQKWADSEQPLIIAQQAFKEVFKDASPASEFAHAHFLLGDALQKRGANVEAIEQFRSSMELYRSIYGPQNGSVLVLMARLGLIYASQGDYARASAAFREYAEAIAQVYGKQSDKFAYAIVELSRVVFDSGNYTLARELSLQAIEIRKAVGGDQGDQIRMLVAKVADCDARLGKIESAIGSYEAVVEELRKLENHDELRWYLQPLAKLEAKRGQDERAEALALEALTLCAKLHGDQDFKTIEASNTLCTLWLARIAKLQSEEKLADAATLLEQLVAEHVKRYGENHPMKRQYELELNLVKQVLVFPAEKQQTYFAAVNDTLKAKKLLKENQEKAAGDAALAAAESYRKLLGNESPKLAAALCFAASCLPPGAKGEGLCREALKIRQTAFGEKDFETASVHEQLGRSLLAQHHYADAIEHLKLSLDFYTLNEAAIGSKSRADVLAALGFSYIKIGELTAAQQALDEADRLLPLQPLALIARGLLALVLGDHDEYLRFSQLTYDRLLQGVDRESNEGLTGTLNLADGYILTANFEKAEPLLQESMEILKKQGRENDAKFANFLVSMSKIQAHAKEHELALASLNQAHEILAKTSGKESRDYQYASVLLARHYRTAGKLAEAESLLLQAYEVNKKLGLGASGVQISESADLMGVLIEQGKFAEATVLAEESLLSHERMLSAAASFQTERQQAATIREARYLNGWYLVATVNEPKFNDKAYDHVLRLKGSIFARQRRLRELAKNPAAKELLERWGRLTGTLATLSLRAPYPEERTAWNQRIALLTADKDDLEKQLLALASKESSHIATAEQIRKSLPAKTALVDFFYNDAYKVNADGTQEIASDFRAFISRPDQSSVVRIVGTGAAELSAAIDRWREAIDWRDSEAAKQAKAEDDTNTLQKLFAESQTTQREMAAVIKKLIWEPLEPHLQGVELVVVSPDGPLAKFPLAALPGKQENSYLIEDIALTTVAVPSMLPELLAGGSVAQDKETLLVMGDVAYGGAAGLADVRGAVATNATRAWLPFSFSVLNAVRAEMDDILRFFGARFTTGKSMVLDGESATENAFRREAPQHRWVHLSTHGFYAPDILNEAQSAAAKVAVTESALVDSAANAPGIVHEGLKSGLALAGANEINASGEDDGILSAMEVSSMDLTGVQMAVLSACETGLGNSVSGEGVAGLQRAFQIAGARSTVTSLWPVGDVSSRLLIARFYRNLWTGKMSKAAAMREAQQWMIAAAYKDDGQEKIDTENLTIDSEVLPQTFRLPEHWAPFVLSGDWR